MTCLAANAMGRWNYGPWFFPPTPIAVRPGAQRLLRPDVRPVESQVRAALDARHAQPLLGRGSVPRHPGGQRHRVSIRSTVEPKAYRFRILNAAHDRFWNLHLYMADMTRYLPELHRLCLPPWQQTEVKMVPAALDRASRTTGRRMAATGGVPDPATRRSLVDPDRHRRRLPADAGRGSAPADRLEPRPADVQRRQRLGPRAASGTGGAGRRHRRLLRRSPARR